MKWRGGTGRWERDVFVVASPMTPEGFSAEVEDAIVADDVWFPDQGEVKGTGNAPVVLPFRMTAGRLLEVAVCTGITRTAVSPYPIPVTVLTRREGQDSSEKVGTHA